MDVDDESIKKSFTNLTLSEDERKEEYRKSQTKNLFNFENLNLIDQG